jgi:probable rRNA maturation factor
MPPRRRRAAAPLSLSFRIASERWQQYLPFLRRNLKASHEILSPKLLEMSVALVGDARMSSLHEQFMGITGATDVLTFPLETNRRGQVTEGEVVICVNEARRRAREHQLPLEHELLLYALHGMLHLCGYDDRTHRAYAKMHRTEDEILQRLGIGAVFAPARLSATTASSARSSQRNAGRSR